MRFTAQFVAALSATAHLAHAGWYTECEDIVLRGNGYLSAVCPTQVGTKRKSWIYLNRWMQNNNGELEWKIDGYYSRTCRDCVWRTDVPGKLYCNCRPTYNVIPIGTIETEQHIKNVNGTLLSDLAPFPNPYPVSPFDPPEDMSWSLNIYVDQVCDQLRYAPSQSNIDYCINGKDDIINSVAFEKNPGYELRFYSEKDCAGKLVRRTGPVIQPLNVCEARGETALSVHIRGLWYPN